MPDLSALCKKGMHRLDSNSRRLKGCFGTARDTVRETYGHRYIEHPCRCPCHAEPTSA